MNYGMILSILFFTVNVSLDREVGGNDQRDAISRVLPAHLSAHRETDVSQDRENRHPQFPAFELFPHIV